MKKFLVVLIVAVLILLGLVATGGSASASDPSCKRLGTTNAFSIDKPTNYQFPDENDTFPEFVCDKGGFDTYVAKANTSGEYNRLKVYAEDFANDSDTITPVMFCKTGKNRGFVIDLAYYWGLSDIKLKKSLRLGWGKYLKKYKSAHTCVIYSKKGQ